MQQLQWVELSVCAEGILTFNISHTKGEISMMLNWSSEICYQNLKIRDKWKDKDNNVNNFTICLVLLKNLF